VIGEGLARVDAELYDRNRCVREGVNKDGPSAVVDAPTVGVGPHPGRLDHVADLGCELRQTRCWILNGEQRRREPVEVVDCAGPRHRCHDSGIDVPVRAHYEDGAGTRDALAEGRPCRGVAVHLEGVHRVAVTNERGWHHDARGSCGFCIHGHGQSLSGAVTGACELFASLLRSSEHGGVDGVAPASGGGEHAAWAGRHRPRCVPAGEHHTLSTQAVRSALAISWTSAGWVPGASGCSRTGALPGVVGGRRTRLGFVLVRFTCPEAEFQLPTDRGARGSGIVWRSEPHSVQKASESCGRDPHSGHDMRQRCNTSTNGTMNVSPGPRSPSTRPSRKSTPSSYCWTTFADIISSTRATARTASARRSEVMAGAIPRCDGDAGGSASHVAWGPSSSRRPVCRGVHH
jgi:hypothetical protein